MSNWIKYESEKQPVTEREKEKLWESTFATSQLPFACARSSGVWREAIEVKKMKILEMNLDNMKILLFHTLP